MTVPGVIAAPVTSITRWPGGASRMVVLLPAPIRLTALSSVTLVVYVPVPMLITSPAAEPSTHACSVVLQGAGPG
jgi:hypothetical protein